MFDQSTMPEFSKKGPLKSEIRPKTRLTANSENDSYTNFFFSTENSKIVQACMARSEVGV